ncbi:hypothetical protein Dsin_024792 [Dipteronia sinensis]|uniref:Uncharacterized protein n=1 Tax=Dipteronia sinensis TaxID=43782 RepID=A0AAD9ZV41_9ROSI|nr:hypothetical protein Dsin_024792 [Dipteronia sinensis]
MFEEHGLDMIVFEVEESCYVPPPLEESSSSPNLEPSVLDMECGYHALGWCDMDVEMLNYEGDSEKDDDKNDEADEANEDGEGDNRQYNKVLVCEEEYVDRDDVITKECMDLFEGYRSKSDNEYFSDSEREQK